MWREEWKRLRSRIQGLEAMIELYAGRNDLQYEAPTAVVRGEVAAVRACAEKFAAHHERALHPGAVDALKDYLDLSPTITGDIGLAVYQLNLVRLRCRLDYFLVDPEDILVRCAERAFAHLQRLLVADDDIRAKWQRAFERGETACEKLGATHLLLHGIWAFKAKAKGAETDLVLGDRLLVDEQMRAAATGFALTEWKTADATDADEKIEEALRQAELYTAGSLAGFELKRTRYIVLVSERRLVRDAVVDHKAQSYRVVNIAINRLSPSKEARQGS